SENIRVISILGKYLEHARAFYFKNDEAGVYISSADWMPRNLTRRIELLTAIKDPKAKEKIIQILKLQCADNSLAHELQSDGSYIKVKQQEDTKAINNHVMLEEYVNKVSKAVAKDSSSAIDQIIVNIFSEEA
ncbi:MAG: RNA degradosome polyphosphate kinase, partial [Sulfurimonas denitrificans]|nr:RNA degradosome polyphosphate kinase [Sulfurimonas denitrificans]